VALAAADVGSACNDDASCVSVKLPEACGAALAGVAVSELCPVSCGTCHVVRAKRAAQQPTIKTEGKTLVFEGVANSDFRFRAAPIDTSIKEILEGLRKVVTVVEPSIKAAEGRLQLSIDALNQSSSNATAAIAKDATEKNAALAKLLNEELKKLSDGVASDLGKQAIATGTKLGKVEASVEALKKESATKKDVDALYKNLSPYVDVQSVQCGFGDGKFFAKEIPCTFKAIYPMGAASKIAEVQVTYGLAAKGSKTGTKTFKDKAALAANSGGMSSVLVPTDVLKAGEPCTFVFTIKSSMGSVVGNSVAVTNTFPEIRSLGSTFACQPKPWGLSCGAGKTCSLCTATVTTQFDAIFYASFTGHVRVAGSAMYTVMSFDNDMKPEGSTTNQWAAMGHTYSTTWESHHTARVSKVLKAGKHTIQMLFKGGASSYVNGAGLNGFYVKASADTSSKNCKYSSWAQTWSRNQVKTMCAIDLKANRNSIAYGTFTGHARHNSGASYGTIGFNNDVNSQAAAHNQLHAPCHSYSGSWEVYGGGRARVFPKADVKIESKLSCHASNCYLNGAGMSALVFPTEDTNKGYSWFKPQTQFFQAKPSGWGVGCGSAGCYVFGVEVRVPWKAVLFAEFNGHYRVNGGWCYAAVSFSNSNGDLSSFKAENKALQLAHGYSKSWEVLHSSRAITVDPGSYKVRVMLRGSSYCYLNGAGLTGFFFPAL